MTFRVGFGAVCALLACFGAVSAQPAGAVMDQRSGEVLRRLSQSLRTSWAAKAATGETPATTVEPSITAGRILTPSIDVAKAPGAPAVSLTLNAGTVGAQYVEVGIVSPAGNSGFQNSGGYSLPAYPPEPKTETLSLQLGYPFLGTGILYTAPGSWKIYMVSIMANDGSFITYQGAALVALFPSLSINVLNSSTPDFTPPTVTRGRILTPSVSIGGPSPYFAVRIPVADDLSGVANVSVYASSGTSYGFGTSSDIGLPVMNAPVNSVGMVLQGFPLGTYTIQYISVCDAAANCTYENTPAQVKAILGSTTFKVTP